MKKTIALIALMAMSGSSFAALYARDLDGDFSNGHEGVYDDVLNITWLADANFAATNNFGLSLGNGGFVNWYEAQTWVSAMNEFQGGSGWLGISNWRLPQALPVNGTAYDTSYVTYDGSSDHGHQISAPVDATYNSNGQSAGFTGNELAYHYYNNFEALGTCSGVGDTVNSCVDSSIRGLDDAPDPKNYKALFTNLPGSSIWSGSEIFPGSSDAFEFFFNSGYQDIGAKNLPSFAWAVADGDYGIAVVPVPAAVWLFLSALISLLGIRKYNREPQKILIP